MTALHPLGPAVLDHRRDLGGRDHDHGQVDGSVDVADGRHGAHPADVLGAGVDRVHGAVEVVGQQVAQHRVAHARALAARADDRHRAGRQQQADRLGLGPLGACLDGGLGLGRGLQVEVDLDHALVERAAGLEPGLPEHGHHAAVRRQHGGREGADPRPPGRDGQVLEQHGGDAPSVVGVVDEERHLGLGAQRPAVVAGHADHDVVAQGDERHAVDVVDVDQVTDLVVAEVGVRGEVAEVDALGRLPGVEVADAGGVVGPDGPDPGGAAVGQDHVGVPLGRVAVRDRHLAGGRQRGGVVHPAERNGVPRPACRAVGPRGVGDHPVSPLRAQDVAQPARYRRRLRCPVRRGGT